MDRLRVSVVGSRGLVTELIEAAIAAEPGVTVVPFDPAAATERTARDEGRPDVVVIESSGLALAESWRKVMVAGPGMTILAVDSTRGTGIEYEMQPHAELLGEISPADIATVIRRIAEGRAPAPKD